MEDSKNHDSQESIETRPQVKSEEEKYENLDDFRASLKDAYGNPTSIWSPIFPEEQRLQILRDAAWTEDNRRLAEEKKEGFSDLGTKENIRVRDEQIEEYIKGQFEMDKKDLDDAKEKIRDAEKIRIMQKNFLGASSYIDLLFHENDYKKNGGHIEGQTRFRLSILLGALNLPEKDLMELINALEGHQPNFGRDGFYQKLANLSHKEIQAFKGSGNEAFIEMQYIPRIS